MKSKIKNQKSKIKNLTNSIICLFVGSYMTSCTMSSGSLPFAQGSAGDVLVVMRENLWKTACGDSIRNYLTEYVWGLPGAEPMFTLSHHVEFTNYARKYRNVLYVNVDPGFENARLVYKTDAYARNQLIFNLEAPTADSAVACMYRNKKHIIAQFLKKDRDAIIEDYKRSEDQSITGVLREKFQVDIIIPRPYKMHVEKDDFVWIAREEGERQWGILMWKDPYKRRTQLSTDSLIFKMNAMTRRNVPGSVTGSYMADEPLVPPEVKIFEKNDIFSVQLNGLWQMQNGWIGGPYVNHTIVDIKRGQLVTAMGFVFYPNREKRLMVRQLEAILYTMMPADM